MPPNEFDQGPEPKNTDVPDRHSKLASFMTNHGGISAAILTLSFLLPGMYFSHDEIGRPFREAVNDTAATIAHVGSFILHNTFDDMPHRP